jgi:hypothetical protein
VLLRLPLPQVIVSRVLGLDDFALRLRGRADRCRDRERIDVAAGRKADALQEGLRDHPGVEVVCRHGSGA